MLRGLFRDLGAAVGAAGVLVLVDPRSALHAVTEPVDLRPVALTGTRKVQEQPDAVVDDDAAGGELVDVGDSQIVDITPPVACA
jgi:hypothetical protein